MSEEVVAESLRAKPPLPVVCPIVCLQPPQGTFYEPTTITIPYLAKDRDRDKEAAPTIHLMAGTTGIHSLFISTALCNCASDFHTNDLVKHFAQHRNI